MLFCDFICILIKSLNPEGLSHIRQQNVCSVADPTYFVFFQFKQHSLCVEAHFPHFRCHMLSYTNFQIRKTVQKLESSIISHCGRTVFGWKDNKYVRLNQLKAWNWFSLPGSTQSGQEGNGAGGFTTFEFIPPDMKRAVCADLSWHLVGQSTNYQVY